MIVAGADLVFFSDGLMQTDKTEWWCKKQNICYRLYYGMLSHGVVIDRNTLSSKQFKCPFLVQSVIQTIKNNALGEVYITSGVECDRGIAKHAMDNKALAIVSGDTDFLFFEGPFKLWYHNINLDLSASTMDHFDRAKLRSILQLNGNQMKIFATIAGNDITKPYGDRKYDLQTIASICQNLNIDSTNEILSHLSVGNDRDGREIVRKSIEFYNIEGVRASTKNNDFNALVHSFKYEKFFSYDVSFFDFGTGESGTKKRLIDCVKEVFRKLGGLLLQGDEEKKLNILTKYSHYEEYRAHKLTPNFEMSLDDERRIKLLWCLGLDDDIIRDLGDILKDKKRLLLPMLSILFLKKVYAIHFTQKSFSFHQMQSKTHKLL